MSTRQRKLIEAPQIPDVVRDETATVPAGETGYWLLMDDATVELLASGVCPALVAKQAWEMLGWKRAYARNCARELNDLVVK